MEESQGEARGEEETIDMFSVFYMYGSPALFREALRLAGPGGYLRGGSGPWFNELRLVYVFGVFSASGDTVATIETWKFVTDSGSTMRSSPQLEQRNTTDGQRFLEKWGVTLSSDSVALATVIEAYARSFPAEAEETTTPPPPRASRLRHLWKRLLRDVFRPLAA